MTELKTDVPVRFVRMKSGDDLVAFAAPHMHHLELVHPFKINYMLDPETASMMTLLTPWVVRGIVDVPLYEVKMEDVLFMKGVSSQMDVLYKRTLLAYRESESAGETTVEQIDTLEDDGGVSVPVTVMDSDQSTTQEAATSSEPSYVNLAGVSEERVREFMANTSPSKKTLH